MNELIFRKMCTCDKNLYAAVSKIIIFLYGTGPSDVDYFRSRSSSCLKRDADRSANDRVIYINIFICRRDSVTEFSGCDNICYSSDEAPNGVILIIDQTMR